MKTKIETTERLGYFWNNREMEKIMSYKGNPTMYVWKVEEAYAYPFSNVATETVEDEDMISDFFD